MNNYTPTENEVNDFVNSYLETAKWSSVQEPDGETDEKFLITDDSEFAPETVETLKADCITFLNGFAHRIESEPGGFDRWTMAGHDFWLTRNGHGAGFWDGGWPVNGDTLTALCGWRNAFDEIELYVGDDGLVYAS